MAAQHKRPGSTAKKERIARVKQSEEQKRYRDRVVVIMFSGRHMYDGHMGKRVALGIPPEEEIA